MNKAAPILKINFKQTCDYLELDRQAVYRLIAQGKIHGDYLEHPTIPIKSRWEIDAGSVATYRDKS